MLVLVLEGEMLKNITCDKGECTQAGKSRNVNLHQVQTVAELHDGMQPIPERPLALLFVEDDTIAESQFSIVRVGAVS